jgi:hypothetical protein
MGLLLAVMLMAHDGNWTAKYKTQAGESCCNAAQDCVRAEIRIVRRTETIVFVEVNGKEYGLPPGSVHIPEDDEDWVCGPVESTQRTSERIPRCVFISPRS